MDPAPSSSTLDFKNIFITPLREFAPWLAAVIFVTWAGYPGVVCVTPMAWLLALRLGNSVVARSRSTTARARKTEAALAGSVFGFLQGVLFAIIILQMQPINDNEKNNAILLTAGMTVVGMLIGAGLSFVTAHLNEQRLARLNNSNQG